MHIAQLKMDRFLTKKRKQDEIDEGESSGSAMANQTVMSEKRPVTNSEQLPKNAEPEKS